jgi:hypothetical protein
MSPRWGWRYFECVATKISILRSCQVSGFGSIFSHQLSTNDNQPSGPNGAFCSTYAGRGTVIGTSDGTLSGRNTRFYC